MQIRIPAGATRRVPGPILHGRIAALRIRLTRHQRTIHRDHRRVAGRISALERVMRRATVHNSYAFSAQVRLQALLSAGIIRHTERVDVRPSRTLAVPAHGIRQPLRVLVTQRVVHQRLVERLTRTEATGVTGAPPRVSVVTRADRRQTAPRIEMTVVRAQAPAAKAAATIAEEAITAAADARPGYSQPRAARPAPPLVLPPQELSRLTDHVIRQLDHRVLSWQERTGRV